MKTCDVLYVHPSKSVGTPEYAYLPVGVVGLMNLLSEEGFKVRGLNQSLELSLNPKFDLERYLRKLCFDIVAIDLHWCKHAFNAIEISRMCKKVNPNSFVILGGFTATFFAAEILEKFPSVDVVIRGDSEEPLIILAKCFDRDKDVSNTPNISYRSQNGAIHHNPITYVMEDLDSLNLINISFLNNWEKYLKTDINGYRETSTIQEYWLCVGRGCTYNCSYCGGSRCSHKILASRDGPVFRSPKKVVEDICLLEDLGVHCVCFTHDPQIISKKYWKEICRNAKLEKIEIGCYIEVKQLAKKEFIQQLARTFDVLFSTIAVSPLSGYGLVRSFNGKLFSTSSLMRCLDKIANENLHFDVYFTANLPKERISTFHQTLDLARNVQHKYRNLAHLFCTLISLDPCCPMSLDPKRFGIIPLLKSFGDYYNAYKHNRGKVIGYETDYLSNEDMLDLQECWPKELNEKSQPKISSIFV